MHSLKINDSMSGICFHLDGLNMRVVMSRKTQNHLLTYSDCKSISQVLLFHTAIYFEFILGKMVLKSFKTVAYCQYLKGSCNVLYYQDWNKFISNYGSQALMVTRLQLIYLIIYCLISG